MHRAFLLLLVATAAAATIAAPAPAAGSYCSPSGDVCVGVLGARSSTVSFSITTAAHYFDRYTLCVRGPKSRICKSFPVHPIGGGRYASTVSWKKNYPDQGKGLYRVNWSYAAQTLTFTR